MSAMATLFRDAEPAPPAPPIIAPANPPAPVRGPFLGLVGSVLGTLGGGWLLLAPFAYNYRAGAGKIPRTTLVDLSTGGAAAAIGLLSAALFGTCLARRLRPAEIPAPAEPEPEPAPEPEPEPVRTVPAQGISPDGDLRDLLGPLVAALTADLRSRQEKDR